MPFYSQGFTLLFLSQSEVLVGRFEKSCHRLPLLWEDEKIIFVLCRTNSCVPRRANTPQIINSFPGFLFLKAVNGKRIQTPLRDTADDQTTDAVECITQGNPLWVTPSAMKWSLQPPPPQKMKTLHFSCYSVQKKPSSSICAEFEAAGGWELGVSTSMQTWNQKVIIPQESSDRLHTFKSTSSKSNKSPVESWKLLNMVDACVWALDKLMVSSVLWI